MFCIQLIFRCLQPISNIQFYSGVQWYACISNSIKPFLENPTYNVISHFEMGIIPLQNGISEHKVNERASVLLQFKDDRKENILNWLSCIMQEIASQEKSHFQYSINDTIKLEQAINLTDHHPFTDASIPFSEDLFSAEIESISTLTELTFSFITPLRLKRPNEYKESGHKYFDNEFFDIEYFLTYLCGKLSLAIEDMCDIHVVKKSLTWVDMAYKNSIGGVMGSVVITGSFTPLLYRAFVLGQYLGLGKNTSFGFGQYRIKESASARTIKHYFKVTLLDSLLNRNYLSTILDSMDKESIDFDGITLQDVLAEKDAFFTSIIRKISSDSYLPAESQSFSKKKKNGAYRSITVYNFTDRFVFKALSKLLADTCDSIFSDNSFAYRAGLGHHKAVNKYMELKKRGYVYGIKTDIESFFDSIPIEPLFLLLDGLLGNDQVLCILEKIFSKNRIGLAQGNALSPFLSNLYMMSFDQLFKNTYYEMIRFADDLLILTKTKNTELLDLVQQSLLKIGLRVATSKTVLIEPDTKLEFLGHTIEHDKIQLLSTSENTEPSWSLLFDKNKMEGIPIYLTYYDSYARTEKENLIIEMGQEKKIIPWKQVQRIVIIGKPRVSAAVIKRALEENKGIQFLNILGNPVGGFNQFYKWINISELLQRRGQNLHEFSLQFIRNTIKAKIHNQRSILQKNGIKSDLLTTLMKSLSGIEDIDVLRGKEGAASAEYFKHFRTLVEPFTFVKREYYPPVGPVNAMLSMGYTLLYNRIGESLLSHGFYPYEGIYHTGKGNHKALASDLMEPFRFIADRIVLQLIHTKQIQVEDFTEINSRGGNCTRLQGEGFRKLLYRFEWTMNQKITERGVVMNYYTLLDEAVKSLYRSIVLGIGYHAFFLR